MTSHKTAKTRKTISAPMKYLSEHGYLHLDNPYVKMLDYGCGKGFDADHFGMDKYDPYYTDGKLVLKDGSTTSRHLKLYHLITCNYVLNVIEGELLRDSTVKAIEAMLESLGKAYITVRRDVVKEGVTKLGTFQENVVLDLQIVKEVKNKYCIYCLTKE